MTRSPGAARTLASSGPLLLLVTAIGWGLNWTALKFVLQDWPPLFARGVAGLAAGAVLMMLAALRRESLRVPSGLYGKLGLAAGINVFAWMGFTALALRWLSVAEGTLLAYTMPIWATLLAWPLAGERPTWRSLLALALGVSGVAVLLFAPGSGDGAQKLPGVVFAVAAALLFAYGAVTARRPLPLPPIVSTAWQVTAGCLPMVILSLALEGPEVGRLSVAAASGVAYMALGPMAACYLTWFAALRRLPSSVAATGMLLVPIVGTLSAAGLLGEPLGTRQYVALLLTLGGVGLALRQRSAGETRSASPARIDEPSDA